MLPLTAQLFQVAQSRISLFDEELAPYSDDEYAVIAMSEFVAEQWQIHPDWLISIRQTAPNEHEWQQYHVWLNEKLVDITDENILMRELRYFRHQMLTRIVWMQTLHLCSTQNSLQQLSTLAEVLIIAARDWLYHRCCADWGTPANQSGDLMPLLIFGMGKLGGGELNFSSDIDLIFVYPQNGVTQGGRREMDNAQFFTRLGQKIIKVLDQHTTEGFVYRVDMRLRPFGDSGPLVFSFAALEDYYQEQGRDWERYAMIKARILGTDHQQYGHELRQMLRPFIFRRYIDFSVIQSLRNMKGMIEREVRRRGLTDNIKLGAGGIREIEFITQVFQLIRGGREPCLQSQSLLPTLEVIDELNLLSSGEVHHLADAYLFLRRLENLLQAINDSQTQTLPDDPLNRQRLAWGMEYHSWNELDAALLHKMQTVHYIFSELIGDGEEDPQDYQQLALFKTIWESEMACEELLTIMPQLSLEDAQIYLQTLTLFKVDVGKRTIGPRGRDVLDTLMPKILSQLGQREDANPVLARLTPLLLSIVSRTTYLELMQESVEVLTHVIRLCAASPMIAAKLAEHPLLLDELLDPTSLYQPLALTAYQDELRQYLLRVPEDDEEQQLEALRQFKQAQLLRIAAEDITGVLPVMKVSDHLTYLAEAIISAVVQQAWNQMVKRYGMPKHLVNTDGQGFAVIGYGKLGGWELGYSSDLDLVFLLDCPLGITTDGPREIDARQFYLRLAQRIMHLFSTRTASGILYDVDARLRPSGESGMLVSTIEAFSDYQKNEAWTWEHQALIRARQVYGDNTLGDAFADVRYNTLCQEREPENLKNQVREMREKMYQHLATHNDALFDIKTSAGGITDIEFIAQYLVLRYAHVCPELTRWSDNVRIFELVAKYGFMPEDEAQSLTHAYVTLRNELHHLALQDKSSVVSGGQFSLQQIIVRTSWQKWFE